MLTEENEAIARLPRSKSGGPHALLARAKYLFDRGEFRSTVETADRVVARDPDHLGALEIRVRAEWRLGDFPAVLRSLRKLTLLNPYEPGYFLMQGDALRMLGRLADARSAYERCVPFEGSPVRYEALLNIEEIDGLTPPVQKADADCWSENCDLSALWMPFDRVPADDLPAWAASARPS